MCPHKETAEHKLRVHPFTDESHPQGWQSNAEKLKNFTAQRTEWKGRRVTERRAENICPSKVLIFKFSASPILSSSMKTSIFRYKFLSRGIGSIKPETRKPLRTGRHNSFSSSNLLVDKVHHCLSLLTGITLVARSYETLQSFRLQDQGTEGNQAFQFHKQIGAWWGSKPVLLWLLFFKGNASRQDLNLDAPVPEMAKIHVVFLCPLPLSSFPPTLRSGSPHCRLCLRTPLVGTSRSCSNHI